MSMKKHIIMGSLMLFLSALFGFHVQYANASLYNCFQEQGIEWQPIEDRAPLAAQYGIWGYRGTAEQNNLLVSYLCPVVGEGELGYSVVTGYQKTLRTTMNSTQSTVPVTSLALKDGETLTMAMLGDRVFLTLEPGKNKEEIVMCTGITASPAQFTGCTRGLAFSGTTTTAVSANQESHGAGSIVVISNVHYVYDEKLDVRGNELTFGDGTDATSKYIYFNDGTSTSTYPAIRWNAADNQLEFRRSGDAEYRVMPTQLRGTYADYASLPATGNSLGDIAITEDDNKLYTWDGTDTWVLAGGSSGAGTVYKTELLGSASDGGDLKTFTLTAGSFPDEKFLLVYKNGQLQSIGALNDYVEVDSNTIQFNYTLASDDLVTMIVVSVDLYNPAWSLVNDDIVPDTNNAYDIGSSTLYFKDIYATGTAYLGDLNVNGVGATSTPTIGAIPIATSTESVLDAGWANATTTGAIPFAGSDGLFDGLPIGSAGQVLQVNSGATAPEWGKSFATGQASRATAAGTGTQTIAHGLGRAPNGLIITAYRKTNANGISQSTGTATTASDESVTYSAWALASGSSQVTDQSSSAIIYLYDSVGSSDESIATLTGLDDTNITLNFTTHNDTADDLVMQWSVY